MVHSFEALGTKWWITIFDEADMLDVIFTDIEHFANDFEQRYSRFIPNSLVSQLNQKRSLEAPDDAFRTLLQCGKSLYMRTATHFNFLTGHILEARGYDSDYSFKDSNSLTLTPGNPITDLTITQERIALDAGNVDVGGFGKGYLIDLIADRLQSHHTLKYFLINGGGDMYATSKFGTPIEILLEHPTEPKKYIARVSLLNTGFAASSPFKRIWGPDGSLSHIVSQQQPHRIASFVTSPSAAEADAFATTALLLDTSDFHALIRTESIKAARYEPDTSQLWQSSNFLTLLH